MTNLVALADLSGQWIDRVHAAPPAKASCSTWIRSVSPTYGDQEGTAYNGHFGCTCYHPLFVFNQFGDLERCALRSGNVHSAPMVGRMCWSPSWPATGVSSSAASFAPMPPSRYPEVYEFLEAEGYKYAIRLPANQVLQRQIGYLLKRPVGRPPIEVRRFYANFSYQAQSWKKAAPRGGQGRVASG